MFLISLDQLYDTHINKKSNNFDLGLTLFRAQLVFSVVKLLLAQEANGNVEGLLQGICFIMSRDYPMISYSVGVQGLEPLLLWY